MIDFEYARASDLADAVRRIDRPMLTSVHSKYSRQLG